MPVVQQHWAAQDALPASNGVEIRAIRDAGKNNRASMRPEQAANKSLIRSQLLASRECINGVHETTIPPFQQINKECHYYVPHDVPSVMAVMNRDPYMSSISRATTLRTILLYWGRHPIPLDVSNCKNSPLRRLPPSLTTSRNNYWQTDSQTPEQIGHRLSVW